MNFSSTSSGPDGYSKGELWLQCSERARLKQLSDSKYSDNDLYPEVDGDPVATLVGTMYGTLAQAYHAGEQIEPGHFCWNDISIEDSHPASCEEARRLFAAHRSEYSPEAFGTVVAVEELIEIPESLFGIRRTGAIDLVTVNDKNELWIRDFKTDGREHNLLEKYSLRHQLWVYALGYELKTGIKPVGVEYLSCVKTQKVKFRRFPFEAMTDTRFRWLKLYFQELKYQMNNPRPQPSLEACKKYERACKYLVEGFCSLIK